MGIKGMLYDGTRCIGCRGCQVACKQWNKLPAEQTSFFAGPGYQNPRRLSAKTWSLIQYETVEDKRKCKDFVFLKRQCMHCKEPSCVSACLVKALRKTPEGPVVYDESKCMGCRYCMVACPFDVPGFEYEKAIPSIRKCNFCYERQQHGEIPACAKACPTRAIRFGDREELLDEAKTRIYRNPGRYVHHVYGEYEAGGTSLLYLSDVPFETFGLPKIEHLGTIGLPSLTQDFLGLVPLVIIVWGGFLGGLQLLTRRREEIAAAEDEMRKKEEDQS